MKCSDYAVLISRRLDGTLADHEAKNLDAHLAQCNRCRAEVVLQKKLIHALKRELPGTLSEDFTRQVTERATRLSDENRRRRFRLADLRLAIPLAAAVAFLVVFGRDLASLTVPAMEALADATAGPLAAFGDRVAEAWPASWKVSDAGLPGSGFLAGIFANVYVGSAIACAVVVWAFSKAYSFVKG
jgi:anti-sigma factor RsiW